MVDGWLGHGYGYGYGIWILDTAHLIYSKKESKQERKQARKKASKKASKQERKKALSAVGGGQRLFGFCNGSLKRIASQSASQPAGQSAEGRRKRKKNHSELGRNMGLALHTPSPSFPFFPSHHIPSHHHKYLFSSRSLFLDLLLQLAYESVALVFLS